MTKTSGYEHDPDVLIHAESARRELFDDPAGVLPTVHELLARVQAAGDAHALAVLLTAMAWAARELLDHQAAAGYAARAVQAGRDSGLDKPLADALTVRAMVNLELGRAEEVRRDLAAARALGTLDAELLFATAVVADATGDLRTSMPILQSLAADEAAPTLVRAKAMINLGDTLSRDDPDQALALLAAAADLLAGESDYLGVVVEHNRGVALAYAGRLGEAMRTFERAGRRLAELGGPPAEHQHEVARVLGDLWLISEARSAVAAALAGLDGEGGAMVRADVLSTAGRLAAEDGEIDAARAAFVESGQLFAAQGRRRGQCLTELGLGRLMLAEDADAAPEAERAAMAERLEAAAGELDELGLDAEAGEARLLAGRLCHQLGEAGRAAELWERVAGGTGADQLIGREAALRLAILAGDAAAGQKIAADALQLLDQRGTLAGSVDLRHRLLRARVDVEALARSALAERPAALQLDALLRQRPPAPVPAGAPDPETQRWRLIWRQLAHRLTSDEESPETLVMLRRQFAEAERKLRLASWSATGGRGREPAGLAELRARLPGRGLAVIARIESRAVGFAVAPGSSEEVVASADLGDWADLVGDFAVLERGLARVASASAGSADRALTLTRDVLSRLELRLSALLRAASPAGQPVQLILDRGLEGACWAALSDLWTRMFAISSLGVTGRSRTAQDSHAMVLLASGPGLTQAEPEIAALSQVWPSPRQVSSAAEVREALPGTSVVHLAAHTRLRWDNPLASAVEFADGPLSLEEILETGAQPRLLYLSGCSLARLTRSGDRHAPDLVGPLPLLAEQGIGEVVASVIPLLDEEAPAIATAVHTRLRDGSTAMAGLADARAGCDPADPASHARWACLAALGVISALP